MLIYYYNENEDFRLRRFNGVKDFFEKYEKNQLQDLEKSSSNFAIQSGNFVNDRLDSLDRVYAVMRSLYETYNCNPQAFASCDFELEAVSDFRDDATWKRMIRGQITFDYADNENVVPDDNLVETVFAQLDSYDAVAEDEIIDVIRSATSEVLEELGVLGN